MALKKLSTHWNEEKVMELAMLSGLGKEANNGNKRSQRMIKELKDYLLNDETVEVIALINNISLSQVEKDIAFWKKEFKKLQNKSIILRDENLSYSNFKGECNAYVPTLNKVVTINFDRDFASLDEIRLYVRDKISSDLNLSFKELINIKLSINLCADIDIN